MPAREPLREVIREHTRDAHQAPPPSTRSSLRTHAASSPRARGRRLGLEHLNDRRNRGKLPSWQRSGGLSELQAGSMKSVSIRRPWKLLTNPPTRTR